MKALSWLTFLPYSQFPVKVPILGIAFAFPDFLKYKVLHLQKTMSLVQTALASEERYVKRGPFRLVVFRQGRLLVNVLFKGSKA